MKLDFLLTQLEPVKTATRRTQSSRPTSAVQRAEGQTDSRPTSAVQRTGRKLNSQRCRDSTIGNEVSLRVTAGLNTFTMLIDLAEPLYAFKAEIRMRTGISPEFQEVVHGSALLHGDGLSLLSFGLYPNAELKIRRLTVQDSYVEVTLALSDETTARIRIGEEESILGLQRQVQKCLSVPICSQLLSSGFIRLIAENYDDSTGERLPDRTWKDYANIIKKDITVFDFTPLRPSRTASLHRCQNVHHRSVNQLQMQRLSEFVSEHVHHYYNRDGLRSDLSRFRTYEAVDWVIKPATYYHVCSYAELISQGNDVSNWPQWYVSHSWNQSFGQLLDCVEKHADGRGLENRTPYWVHSFCANLHERDQYVDRGVLELTQFYMALRQCKGMLIATGSNVGQYFTRPWCCFEAYVALGPFPSRQKPLKVDVTVKSWLFTGGLTDYEENLEHARRDGSGWKHKRLRERTNPLHIFDFFLDFELDDDEVVGNPNWEVVLKFLSGRDAGDPQPRGRGSYLARVSRRLASNFAQVVLPFLLSDERADDKNNIERVQSFVALLRADPSRRTASLNLAGCKGVDDAVLRDIMFGVSHKLDDLSLDLRHCPALSDDGLKVFSANCPANLRRLHLQVLHNNMGDPGLKSLAHLLSLTGGCLKILDLDFGCTLVSNAGLAELVASLPATLEEVYLNVSKVRPGDMVAHISDRFLIPLAKALPKSLRDLRLDLKNTSVSDEGVKALALALPVNVRSLWLGLRGTRVTEDMWRCSCELAPFRELQLALRSGTWPCLFVLDALAERNQMLTASLENDDVISHRLVCELACSSRKTARHAGADGSVDSNEEKGSEQDPEPFVPVALEPLPAGAGWFPRLGILEPPCEQINYPVASTPICQENEARSVAERFVASLTSCGDYGFEVPIKKMLTFDEEPPIPRRGRAALVGVAIDPPRTLQSQRSSRNSSARSTIISQRGQIFYQKFEPAIAKARSIPKFNNAVTTALLELCAKIKTGLTAVCSTNWSSAIRPQTDSKNKTVSWENFSTLCRQTLKISDDSRLLRALFHALGDDQCAYAPNEVNADDLISFLGDPETWMSDLAVLAFNSKVCWHPSREPKPTDEVSWPGFCDFCNRCLQMHVNDLRLGILFKALEAGDSGLVLWSKFSQVLRSDTAQEDRCRKDGVKFEDVLDDASRSDDQISCPSPADGASPKSETWGTGTGFRRSCASRGKKKMSRNRLADWAALRTVRKRLRPASAKMMADLLKAGAEPAMYGEQYLPTDQDLNRGRKDLQSQSKGHRSDQRVVRPSTTHPLIKRPGPPRAQKTVKPEESTSYSAAGNLKSLGRRLRRSSTLARSPSESHFLAEPLLNMQLLYTSTQRVPEEETRDEQRTKKDAPMSFVFGDVSYKVRPDVVQKMTVHAIEQRIEVHEALLGWILFDKFSQVVAGRLTASEFTQVGEEMLRISLQDSEVQTRCREMKRTILKKRMRIIDDTESPGINFPDFFSWFCSLARHGKLLTETQAAANLAKKVGIGEEVLAHLRKAFNACTSDCGGIIPDERTFSAVLHKALKVPPGQELPSRRVVAFWAELDSPRSAKRPAFQDFLFWWRKHFRYEWGDATSARPPFEVFYSEICRVRV